LSAAARRIAEVLCNDITTEDYVFTSPRTGGQLSQIKKGFAAAIQEAGLENFTFHDLRHTFATRLAGAGVDPFTIRDLLGHATVMMSSDYTHSTPETRHAAISGLGEGKRSAETERGKIVAVR
jgi:integrase